jgi:peptidyl-dipeptidase Dcp
MAPPSDLTPPTTGDAAAPGVRQLLTPWPALPGAAARFGGLPPFGQWTAADLEPALRAAMLAARAEIDAIAANPAPDFDNTLVALERSGQALARCQAMLNVMGSTLSTPEVRAAEARLAPELAAFRDTTTQNAALYRRIAAVAADSAQVAALPPEARRLLQVTLERFQREGAMLDEAGKARL